MKIVETRKLPDPPKGFNNVETLQASGSSKGSSYKLESVASVSATPIQTTSRSTSSRPIVRPVQDNAGEMLNLLPKIEYLKPAAEPKVDPPPFTEEDWEIFKKFMDPLQGTQSNRQRSVKKSNDNRDSFACSVCKQQFENRKVIVLRSCSHSFCRPCIVDEIQNRHDLMGQVECPLAKCNQTIDDEEIKAILGDEYAAFGLKIVEMLSAMMKEKKKQEKDDERNALLMEQIENDELDFIENSESFDCAVCFVDIDIGQGVILKNCLHKFCKECIADSVKHSDEFEVKCPYFDDDGESCDKKLREREIRGLVSTEIFDKHLEKSLKLYEGVTQNAIHCLTPDCHGFVEADKNLRGFLCLVCDKVNCIGCKAIHQGKNCQEYQDETNPDGKKQRENAESEDMIKGMIAKGEAMYCPRCGIPVMKTEGCDYMVCSTCKLAICWITKKPRHPLTKDDGTFIDGCHCRENGGPKCHPLCGFCH